MYSAAQTAQRVLLPLLFLACTGSSARAFDPHDIPPDLQPWVPWVLDGHDDLGCALAGADRACVWPGTIRLDIRGNNGTFRLWVRTDRRLTIPLPGGRGAWPGHVVLDGGQVPVLEDSGRPTILVAPGDHLVEGGWDWTRRPDRLRLPLSAGLVFLTIDQRAVPFPAVDKEGWLRLGAQAQETQRHESVQIDVSRRLEDGVPFRITTRLAIRASGRGREITFPGVLIPDTRPVSLTADLPARFEPGGALTIQVRPGNFTVSFDAIHDGPVTRLSVPDPGGNWPDAEYWVLATNDQVRATTVRGLTGIDPARTSLPDKWRNLPAYLAHPGESLEFDEIRRGEPEPPPNRLVLSRTLWLDIDGAGMTVRDTFKGTMSKGWRLDILSPAHLGHVVDHGEDQVITRRDGNEGVELRRSDVDIVAESRLDAKGGKLRAVGWDTDVTHLDVSLHLPPGWTLFAASGTDNDAGTTVDRWSLFDLFFVLIVAIATWRLLGLPWGFVALIGLALSRHDGHAPATIWLALLAVLALLRVVQEGRRSYRIVRWTKYLLVTALYIVMLGYGAKQVRIAIAPVLERPWVTAGQAGEGTGRAGRAGDLAEPERRELRDKTKKAPVPSRETVEQAVTALKRDLSQMSSAKHIAGLYQRSMQQDPAAVVQTGPGVPRWRWDRYHLSWSGTVTADQTLRLYLVSPPAQRGLIFAKLLLLILLALRMSEVRWRLWWRTGATKAVILLSAGTMACLLPGRVEAGPGNRRSPDQVSAMPASDILGVLEQRLTRPPDCHPHCLTVSRVHLEVGAESLRMVAEVHAGADSAFPLLGPASVWVPAEVIVQGRKTTDLARLTDGFLNVRLPRGVTTVIAEGPLPPVDTLTLRFGTPPQRVTWTSDAWTVSGVRADGTVDRAIQLTRRMTAGQHGPATSTENLAPWVRVQRTLDLGIPWQVLTTVTRVGPSSTPMALKLPLLEGEAVIDPGIEVHDNTVQVALDRSRSEVSWRSTLEQRDEIVLEAPAGVPWTERWTVLCSPVFSCTTEGLTPLRHVADGRWAPEWWPWPGERVTVHVTRPEAVAGQTVTVDSARLDYTPGKRMADATLTLDIRSSQGGQQIITLPEQAHVQTVLVDDHAIPLQATRGRLPVPIQPGRQSVSITWQQTKPQGVMERTPRVDIGSPAVNVTVAMKVPDNRWLLWLNGPAVGPVPLFWTLVILVLIAAPILRRVPYTSLKTWEWGLLGLGMIPTSPYAPLVVVLWFVALGYRRKKPARRWDVFDMYQLLLIFLSLGALTALYASIQHGLLGDAPVNIAGNGSTRSHLFWYVDRADGLLPQPAVLSVPLWIWRTVMLAWSLWLAWSLVKWLPEAWRAFAAGDVWRKPPGRR